MNRLLFGSEELTQYYRTMREKIFEYKLYRAYQLEENSQFISMTFFNFYRYKRNLKTGKISAYYFNLKSNKWYKARLNEAIYHFARFSSLPDLMPLKNHNMLMAMIDMMLPKLQKFVDYDKRYSTYDRLAWRMNRLGTSTVNKALQRLILKYAQLNNQLAGHSKYITKFIWRHFIDKSVFSYLIKIKGFTTYFHFSDYIYIHNHLEKVKRVETEYPNLLPLLKYFPAKHWDDPNLFSFDYWTNECAIRELNRIAKIHLPGMTKKQWRWLKKQSPKFIAQWSGQELSCLVECGIQEKIPVCVKIFVIRLSDSFDTFGAQKIRIIRLFILHMLNVWQEQGFRALQHCLKNVANQVIDMADYWRAIGYRGGIPQSWERIVERSNAWHRQYLLEQQQAQDEEHQAQLALQWESPIMVWEEANVLVTALNNGKALFDEGQIMRHCIFSYAHRCAEGKYLAFSVIERDENQIEIARSTLGIYRDIHHHTWEIEQHRGVCNGYISQKLMKIGKKFCQQLNLLSISNH